MAQPGRLAYEADRAVVAKASAAAGRVLGDQIVKACADTIDTRDGASLPSLRETLGIWIGTSPSIEMSAIMRL
jgi:hypothetical protein